jgi:O-antigen ligase
VIASIVVVGALLYSIFPIFAEAYLQRLALSMQYFFESPNAVLSGRLTSWNFLAGYLSEHPWHALFGIGYKTLPYSGFVGSTMVADNTYLSMLLETGIFGLAALILLHLSILRACYAATRSSDSQKRFCATWMLCFWCGEIVQMFSGDLLTYWRVLPVYFAVLAFAVREAAE